jgi:hypothetical protein
LNSFGISAPSPFLSLPTESRRRHKLLTELSFVRCSLFFLFICLLCLLVLFMRLCRFVFRLSGDFGPAVSRLSTECTWLYCCLSLVSLCLSLVLAFLKRLCRFPFQLNGGFGAGFRLNAFGFSGPFLFSLLLAVAHPETVSFHFRLHGGFGIGFLMMKAFGFSAPLLCRLSTT